VSFVDCPVVDKRAYDPPPKPMVAIAVAGEEAVRMLALDPNQSPYALGYPWKDNEFPWEVGHQFMFEHRCCPCCYGSLAYGNRADMSLEECMDCCMVWRVVGTGGMNGYQFCFVHVSQRFNMIRVAVRIARRRAGILE
jgi:hypothetical protein